MSPFSPRCGYQVTEFAWQRRGKLNLSPRDQTLVFRIRLAGAAAFFQICEKKRDKTRLKTMGRAGVLNLYRLEGAYRMNVASWNPLNLDGLLRALILSQFLLISGAGYDGRRVILGNESHELFIFRHGDIVKSEAINRAQSCLILAEEYDAAFDDLLVPAKIALDEDLIANRLRFIAPGIKRTSTKTLD